ncbi:NAD-dependent epimerase/dehydratase family protein [Streptosporangium sp. NPDC000396]|uniref:NAD-dependent epimerase/dehydratase family protein n=1 Tax=Streptosporangium sp. NPDC000396 TaxID=3366185 RepID=UPI00367C5F41
MERRTVLVAGGCGYVGSALVERLSGEGDRVIVVDNGLISGLRMANASYVKGDIREVGPWESLLDGVDVVVNLAAIVGDPACGLDQDLAWETNYIGTVRLAEACRKHRVPRMVFASTCSNYGVSWGAEADVHSALHPKSVYAETKIHAEHYLLSVRDADFSPRILRFATLYGIAPRMRFDLAINVMTARAVLDRKITVANGAQWRPFLHVQDAARAIATVLRGEQADGVPEILNCGSNEQNFRIREIGELIKREVPEAELVIDDDHNDGRDYRVNFDRIRKHVNFTPERSPVDGIREIRDAIRTGDYLDYRSRRYSDHDTLKARLAQRDFDFLDGSVPSWPQMSFTTSQ